MNNKNKFLVKSVLHLSLFIVGLPVAAQGNTIIKNSFFSLSFYKPTYVLPFYYTQFPDQEVYCDHTPENQSLKPYEVKYQLSFKAPLWENIFNNPITLYLAYSQLSYWQAYNKSAFFRETNYEPEVFIANNVNWPFMKINFINLGASHQSNGRGGELERGWDRLYLETILGQANWTVSLKTWYPIPDTMLNTYNPNIAKFLGYERILVSYKYHNQVFSLEVRNAPESGFQRGAEEFTWSFPLINHFSGYVQVFSGYGQSLIEYNHYTNSIGVGIALSNWF